MPHTSRRAAASNYRKERHVVTEDGWTKVIRTTKDLRGHDTTLELDQLPPIDPNLSLAKLKKEFEDLSKVWRQSESRRYLCQLVRQRVNAPVKTAVLLALGTVSREQMPRMRSVSQFVVFMDIVGILQEQRSEKITLYVQEPRLSDLDKEFLRGFGFTVLEDPDALRYVGEQTLLFVPNLEWTIETPYRKAAISCPLYVTSKMQWVLEQAEGMLATLSRDSPISVESSRVKDVKQAEDALASAKAIESSHAHFQIPEFEHSDALTFAVYIKNDNTED